MKSLKITLAVIWGMATAVCCAPNCVSEGVTLSGLDPARYDTVVYDRAVALYTLRNESGMELCVTNFGARMVSLMVEDRAGKMRDVILGFDNIAEYVKRGMAIGATVGRYAGRVAGGVIEIDGVKYQLDQNSEGNMLHGGFAGWMNRPFEVLRVEDDMIEMRYCAEDGEGGFPGAVELVMSYRLTSDDAVEIKYLATTDRPTVVNLTNHSFFNLSGEPIYDISDHVLRVDADNFTMIDPVSGAPSGVIAEVATTPMDLRKNTIVGNVIKRNDFEQIRMQLGLDTRWIFNHPMDENREQIYLYCPRSGIEMRTYTSQPSVHVSSASYLNGTIHGKGGVVLQKYGGICLETQHPLQPPTTTPQNPYNFSCKYKFSINQ